ncbi:MAG: rhodanese-like domain-containing protein [Actinomycetota bacterium]
MDIRSQDHRLKEGTVPGSVHLPLRVLEWRADPGSAYQDSSIQSFDDHLMLICREGFSSSLAARRLQQLGFWRATDVIGGSKRGNSHVCRS